MALSRLLEPFFKWVALFRLLILVRGREGQFIVVRWHLFPEVSGHFLRADHQVACAEVCAASVNLLEVTKAVILTGKVNWVVKDALFLVADHRVGPLVGHLALLDWRDLRVSSYRSVIQWLVVKALYQSENTLLLFSRRVWVAYRISNILLKSECFLHFRLWYSEEVRLLR